MSEAHCNKLPQRKALGLVTHDNTGGPFVVECQGCGEVYPSFHCLGGEQIADTGDYEDARCPHCDQIDPEECDNAALTWNTQQLKINELQQRLNAADEQNDDLRELLAQAMPSVDYHASMKGEEGEHLYHLLSRIRAAIKPATTVPSYPAARPEYPDPDSAKDDDWHMNPCKQGHRDVGAAGGVAACNQCDEKIEAATTQEAFEQWNAAHPPAPTAVVLPERKPANASAPNNEMRARLECKNKGYNEALDDVANLNSQQ